MKRFIYILLLTISILGMATNEAFACSKVNVRRGDDYVKVFAQKNKKYIIKEDIDLGGRKVVIGTKSSLVFQGGSLKNGVVIGNNTRIKETKENVFHDCRIDGTWNLDYSYSSMFDADMEAILLFKNLSTLSPNLRLFANRDYRINKKGEEIVIRSIEAATKEKPKIEFHTTNPNIAGLMLIGENILLKNLIISEDYDIKNDIIYGKNNPLIGNTLAVFSKSKIVQSLIIEGCEFSGGTSSSYVASSQTRNCIVNNCVFSGFLADHAVYCSMTIENFVIEHCKIKDVPHTKGLFKIRTSKNLKYFGLKNIDAHNLNGYMAIASLVKTPLAILEFDNIKATKEQNNSSLFYGFCVTDETKLAGENEYNANSIVFNNCSFVYGYNGNSLISSGAGLPVKVREIGFSHTSSIGTNFGGGYTDALKVYDCFFEDFCNEKGISIAARSLVIEKTILKRIQAKKSNCVFLINYKEDNVKSISLNRVTIDAEANSVFNISEGNNIDLTVNNCSMRQIESSIVTAPARCNVHYKSKNYKIIP